MTVREGIGTGFGRAPQPELAHDIALKAAETDATKRALATFGNPFGLALYDRDQAQVTKARTKVASRDDAGTRVARSGADQSRGSRSPFPRSSRLRRGSFAPDRPSGYGRCRLRLLVAQFRRLRKAQDRGWARRYHSTSARRGVKGACAPGRTGATFHLQWRDKRSNFCRRAGGRILSDPKGEADSRSGASRLCRQPALLDLRPPAGASASLTLCAAARHGDEGLG